MQQYQVITTSRRRPKKKINRYVDLQIDCQRMWNKNVEVVPIVIGATGLVDKNLKRHMNRIPAHHYLGIAHILRRLLSFKPD